MLQWNVACMCCQKGHVANADSYAFKGYTGIHMLLDAACLMTHRPAGSQCGRISGYAGPHKHATTCHTLHMPIQLQPMCCTLSPD